MLGRKRTSLYLCGLARFRKMQRTLASVCRKNWEPVACSAHQSGGRLFFPALRKEEWLDVSMDVSDNFDRLLDGLACNKPTASNSSAWNNVPPAPPPLVAFPLTKRSDSELGLGGKEIQVQAPHLGFWRAGMLRVWGVSGALLALYKGPRPVGRHP